VNEDSGGDAFQTVIRFAEQSVAPDTVRPSLVT
jgi:hypothetical protein